MAPYRNRVVIVDAVQFRAHHIPWPDGVDRAALTHGHATNDPDYYPSGSPVIRTAHGLMLVREGDWIITQSNGNRYICKDVVFRAIWEPHQTSPIITVQ